MLSIGQERLVHQCLPLGCRTRAWLVLLLLVPLVVVLEGPLLRPQLLRIPEHRILVAMAMQIALVQQAPMQW